MKLCQTAKDHWHVFAYLLLASVVVYPLFKGPYLFLLDSVPKLNNHLLKEVIYGERPPVYGGWMLDALSFILPPQHYQAILIFLLLFISSISMYYLTFSICKSRVASFYAGLLYAINPYTYIRIIVGHIVLAYAFIPAAIKLFMDVLEKRDTRSVFKFALMFTLVATNSHMLFISAIALSIILLFKMWKSKNLEILKFVTLSAIVFCGCNLYWMAPAVLNSKESLLPNISQTDLLAFAPRTGAFPPLFTLASMYGFWRPGYIYAKDFLPFWWVLFIFIFFLAVHGFNSYYNDKKLGIYVKAFAAMWLVGLILAAGIRSPFAGLFVFLFNHIPLLRGMRDTHKFVTMLCLSYSCLGALGLVKIEKSLENKKTIIKNAVIFAILLIPLIYSFTFFNGFAGQIKPADFPKDWYAVRGFLNNDKNDFRVLFFPWHLYMDFRWVPNRDKRIVNPAPNFFDEDVISGRNIEIDGIYSQIHTPYQVYIDHLLRRKNEITNFGELVSILGVKYILLTKEADYKNYFFLFNQTDLELVKKTENFYVFKNKAFRGLMFSVNGTGYVKNWNDMINISRTQDITKRLYLIGSGKKEGNEAFKKLKFVKAGPIKYIIKDKPLKYVVFTEEYSRDWELNGEEPLKAYGVVNAYGIPDNSGPKEIVYDGFYRICLPSYAVSLLTLVACLSYLIFPKLKQRRSKRKAILGKI